MGCVTRFGAAQSAIGGRQGRGGTDKTEEKTGGQWEAQHRRQDLHMAFRDLSIFHEASRDTHQSHFSASGPVSVEEMEGLVW